MADVESGTHAISRGLSVLEVEQACDDADVALAEAAACLDFLSQLGAEDQDSARALVDARIAVVRVSAAVAALRTGCERVQTAYTYARPGRVA